MRKPIRLLAGSVTEVRGGLSGPGRHTLSVVEFIPSDRGLESSQKAYMRLLRGERIEIEAFSLIPFDRETESLLMAERPLYVTQIMSEAGVTSEKWLLEMP